MRGNAMRHDNVEDAVPILRARKRAVRATSSGTHEEGAPAEESLGRPQMSADDVEESTGEASEQKKRGLLAASGMSEDAGSLRGGRRRLFAGTGLTVLAIAGIIGGAALLAPRFGILVPFINDAPHARPYPVAAQTSAKPLTQLSQNALTPPALSGPAVAIERRAPTQDQAPANPSVDDPFGGEGVDIASKAQPTPPVLQRQPIAVPLTADASAAASAQSAPTPGAAQTGSVPSPQNASEPHPAYHPEPEPPKPSLDEALELQLANKLQTVDDHVSALEKQMAAVQQALQERISTGFGKVDGRIDELQHRQDQSDQTLRSVQASSTQPVRSGNSTIQPHAVVKPLTHAAPVPVAAARTTPSVVTENRPAYRVQAGAPDIAILQDASGDAIRVQTGSTVPGWGHVEGVVQAGSGWVVRTEKGVIH